MLDRIIQLFENNGNTPMNHHNIAKKLGASEMDVLKAVEVEGKALFDIAITPLSPTVNESVSYYLR